MDIGKLQGLAKPVQHDQSGQKKFWDVVQASGALDEDTHITQMIPPCNACLRSDDIPKIT
jgi:hypothetical protein